MTPSQSRMSNVIYLLLYGYACAFWWHFSAKEKFVRCIIFITSEGGGSRYDLYYIYHHSIKYVLQCYMGKCLLGVSSRLYGVFRFRLELLNFKIIR